MSELTVKKNELLDAACILMDDLPESREQFLKCYWEAMNLNAEKCVMKTIGIQLKLEAIDPDALIPYNHFRPRPDFFMLYPLQLRQAMRTWMLISNRLRFPKDIRHLICDYITRRNEAEWTYECIACGKPLNFAHDVCNGDCYRKMGICGVSIPNPIRNTEKKTILCRYMRQNFEPGTKCFNHTPKENREVQVKVKRK